MDGGPQPAPQPAPWAPLDLAEANGLLHRGGYDLRVERFRSGFRLAGAGAGVGVPLTGELTWLGLCEVLARLRRTRQRHDPAWLDGMAQWLRAPGLDDRGLADPGLADPGVVGPDSGGEPAGWTGLAPDRVERRFAGELPEQVRGCLESLVDAGGAVRFPADALARGGGWPSVADLTGDPADRSVRLQTTSGGSPLTDERVRESMRGWEILSSAVCSSPYLAGSR